MKPLTAVVLQGFQNPMTSPFMFLLVLLTLFFLGLITAQVSLARRINLTPSVIATITITIFVGIMATCYGISSSYSSIINASAAARALELAQGIHSSLSLVIFGFMMAIVQTAIAGITTVIANKRRDDRK